MDEAEWLACADPDRMLKHLGKKYSGRKLRLFAVACCRRVWERLDPLERKAVEVAERYADGLSSREELDAAGEAASSGTAEMVGLDKEHNPAVWVTSWSAQKAATDSSAYAAGWAVRGIVGHRTTKSAWEVAFAGERERQCDFLRDIVGNPFRPVVIPPAVLAWSGGTVVKLAQAIYDDRRFGELPVLADALEDAGCTDAAILVHCRGPGEHVRGCWVVDLLLGRA